MIRISGIVEIAEDHKFAPMASGNHSAEIAEVQKFAPMTSRNHSADSAEDHKFAPMTIRNHSADSARESPIRLKQLLTFFLSMRRLLLGLLLGLLKEN